MTIRILVGDARNRLSDLGDESVNCVVTSPPYYGLRDYGTAQWEGGDPACDHSVARRPYRDSKQATNVGSSRDSFAGVSHCRRCGAQRIDRQIGLEETPDEYVKTLVDVFREIRRVLRKDGTLWLNLGDSYCSGQTGFGASGGSYETERRQWTEAPARQRRTVPPGLKPKDLIGVPWRVAFALQADGWWLRQDIIWSKVAPMPEPVTDRCTKAHEYIFLLSKSGRYYYDQQAIAERATYAGDRISLGVKSLSVGQANGANVVKSGNALKSHMVVKATRNKRSVWTIAGEPYGGAHFATFPPKLVEPCILAGCPQGGMVLDPFAGSGTVGLVAAKSLRDATLIELNQRYALMAEARLKSNMVDGVIIDGDVVRRAPGEGMPMFSEAIL